MIVIGNSALIHSLRQWGFCDNTVFPWALLCDHKFFILQLKAYLVAQTYLNISIDLILLESMQVVYMFAHCCCRRAPYISYEHFIGRYIFLPFHLVLLSKQQLFPLTCCFEVTGNICLRLYGYHFGMLCFDLLNCFSYENHKWFFNFLIAFYIIYIFIIIKSSSWTAGNNIHLLQPSKQFYCLVHWLRFCSHTWLSILGFHLRWTLNCIPSVKHQLKLKHRSCVVQHF